MRLLLIHLIARLQRSISHFQFKQMIADHPRDANEGRHLVSVLATISEFSRTVQLTSCGPLDLHWRRIRFSSPHSRHQLSCSSFVPHVSCSEVLSIVSVHLINDIACQTFICTIVAVEEPTPYLLNP